AHRQIVHDLGPNRVQVSGRRIDLGFDHGLRRVFHHAVESVFVSRVGQAFWFSRPGRHVVNFDRVRPSDGGGRGPDVHERNLFSVVQGQGVLRAVHPGNAFRVRGHARSVKVRDVDLPEQGAGGADLKDLILIVVRDKKGFGQSVIGDARKTRV